MPVDAVARVRTLANTIVTDLNTEIAAKQSDGTAISPARFTAAVNYYPEYRLGNLNDVRIDVRLVDYEAIEESKGGFKYQAEIEITVQQAIKWDEAAAIGLLIDLSNRIARRYFTSCAPCTARSASPGSSASTWCCRWFCATA